jgi:hypothetical protein
VVVDVTRGEAVHDEVAARVEQALGDAPVLPSTVNTTPVTDPRADLRPQPSRGPGAGPWVLLGAGAASLAAGGAFLYLRGDALQTFHGYCRTDGTCPDEPTQRAAQPARDDAALFTTLSVVAGAVGVAAITGAVLWYALSPRRAAATALRVSPWSTTTAVGLSLGARF